MFNQTELSMRKGKQMLIIDKKMYWSISDMTERLCIKEEKKCEHLECEFPQKKINHWHIKIKNRPEKPQMII